GTEQNLAGADSAKRLQKKRHPTHHRGFEENVFMLPGHGDGQLDILRNSHMSENNWNVFMPSGELGNHAWGSFARHAGVKDNRHPIASRRVVNRVHQGFFVGIEKFDFGMKLDSL